jgi:trans-aconitate 2-methyltransferase
MERLDLRGDETVLDAGCGSGRVTQLLVNRLPRGRVIAVDKAASMVQRARETLGSSATIVQADLLALRLDGEVDAVFSTAVFHHIADHERLFASLRGVLRPGGALVAQCGGKGNIAAFRAQVDSVAARPPYAEHLRDMGSPWHYASPEDTERRLRAAGFSQVRCWLEPRAVEPDDPRAFMGSVLLNYHLARLPPDLSDMFVTDVQRVAGGADETPLHLDYVRLNMDARAAA